MDPSSRQQEQQSSRLFTTGMQSFNHAIQWLGSLLQLTQEEQEDAGICYAADEPISTLSSTEKL